jgi:predicted DNA-binding transcriptional regulator YafY
MDVLRHSHHVEVLEPPELRSAIQGKLERASQLYRTPSGRPG